MMAFLWVVGIWAMSMITIHLFKKWFGGSNGRKKNNDK